MGTVDLNSDRNYSSRREAYGTPTEEKLKYYQNKEMEDREIENNPSYGSKMIASDKTSYFKELTSFENGLNSKPRTQSIWGAISQGAGSKTETNYNNTNFNSTTEDNEAKLRDLEKELESKFQLFASDSGK